jgi:broad specificity phosphatase PhoE
MRGMTLIYLVQHGEKEPGPGDPGLTGAGREQAGRTARWLHGFGLNAVYGSPQRRRRLLAPGRRAAARVPARRGRRARPVAAATHGGVTVDLLRTLLGEGVLPRGLLHEGVPSCAVTTVHNLDVIEVASVAHL